MVNCSVVSTQTLFLPGSTILGRLLAVSSFSIVLICKMGMDENSTFVTELVPGITETKDGAQSALQQVWCLQTFFSSPAPHPSFSNT